MAEEPFHEKDYRKENEHYGPFLDILIGKAKVPAFADTGCDAGVSVFKNQTKDWDLGKKINDEPIDISVADGHIIGGDAYLSTVEIDGIEKEVLICVVDPTVRGFKPERIPPLVGRGFLDNFDVLFQGKERKISLFHP